MPLASGSIALLENLDCRRTDPAVMAKCFRNAPVHYKHINGHVDVIMMKLHFLPFSSFQRATYMGMPPGKAPCPPVPAMSGTLGAGGIEAQEMVTFALIFDSANSMKNIRIVLLEPSKIFTLSEFA